MALNKTASRLFVLLLLLVVVLLLMTLVLLSKTASSFPDTVTPERSSRSIGQKTTTSTNPSIKKRAPKNELETKSELQLSSECTNKFDSSFFAVLFLKVASF
jgi:anionic cell wall polymer biosynthesis LytR-Cps2A-Psr (LCP) family protein